MSVLEVKCYRCQNESNYVQNKEMEELGWYEFKCSACDEEFLLGKTSYEFRKNRTGEEIIKDVCKRFVVNPDSWCRYYTMQNDNDEWLDSEVLACFEESDKVNQFKCEKKHFEKKGYEATVIFFSWTDAFGVLHAETVLTECM